jgi:hypothetical protein
MRRPGLLAGLLAAALAPVPGCSDDTCADCIEEKCPSLLELCRQDTDCACAADCLGDKGVPGVSECLGRCGVSERPQGFAALEICVASWCPDSEDECSTPSDYVPPELLVCEGPDVGIGGGALADCAFDPVLQFDPSGNVLQLQSADQQVCVRLTRRNDGPGSLANTKWTLLDIRIGPLQEVALVEDPAALCWFSSHHNFVDWAHAWTGIRRFELKIEGVSPASRTYVLYTFEQGPVDPSACPPTITGKDCIGEPIELLPVNP